MALDPKSPPPAAGPGPRQDKGMRIFTYPKIIFMVPTLVVSIICGIGMLTLGNGRDPRKPGSEPPAAAKAEPAPAPAASAAGADPDAPAERFKEPENLLGILFLGVLAFNLLIMAIDFPRFTIVAGFLLVGFAVFFILWIGAYFNVDLMHSVRSLMAGIYVWANAAFYFTVAAVLAFVLGIVYLTRHLDYWQVLPNEILHHHGPFSDLERFPTNNLKFDKEIPDILEFMFFGAGRLVLHVTEQRKAIVLDNVLFINQVESRLKNLMSRMEVRITTDQEVSDV